MLTVTIPGVEYFDDDKEEFITYDDTVLQLEHSLVTLSKWEAIYEKPFMGDGEKTHEEILGYIQCMCLTPNVPPEIFHSLSEENLDLIQKFINGKHTATWFNDGPQKPGPRRKEIITAEIIYHWLIEHSIPFDPCQNWHLNQLITFVQVRNKKLAPEKKSGMGRKEMLAERQRLNEARKAQYGTSG